MANKRFASPLWHLIDAKDQVVGKLATQIVHILRGKHKPTFSPNYDCGDYVVVVNAKYVKFTGKKLDQKKYIWHTGYPGGLKQITARELLFKKPEEVL
jgi:large subunit ribosomal protein L13